MFISEEDVVNRVSSLDNLINRLQLRKINNGGRPKGRKNDTNEDRLDVAEYAMIHGTTKAAEKFNTTPSRASLLKDGVITHASGKDEELAPAVENKRETIHNKALDILTNALNSLDPKIPEITKPTELAAIATEMAKIAERTGGRLNPEEENKPKVQVVIFAPRMKEAEEFETIDI
jgi:hypothetical protein